MLKRNWWGLRAPEDGDGGSSGGAAAPAAAPAAPAAPAAAPAAPAPSPSPAPAAPAPAPAAAKADGDDGKAKPDWPDDWREKASKGNAKVRDRLGRYASPVDAVDALIAAQDRIRSGEVKPVLPKDAKPEEITAWRKEHGIPEKADDYDLKGVKLDDSDKPFIAEVLKAGHAAHMTPEVAKAVVSVWPELKKQAFDAQSERDQQAAQASEDALRAEWGTDFRRHMNLIHGLLDGSGSQKLKDSFLFGRLADGTPIGSSPEVLKMLLGVALRDNPTGIVVPGGTGDQGKAIDSEIGEIEKAMRTDRAAYNKNEKMQKRYLELLQAKEAMQKRAA